MSKADEMFKELGYYKQNKPIDNDLLLFYTKDCEYILFYKDKEISTICNNRDYIFSISMEELQAINEKVKELGWND